MHAARLRDRAPRQRPRGPRAVGPRPVPLGLTGPVHGLTTAAVLHLQRTAGNAAASALLSRPVQRCGGRPCSCDDAERDAAARAAPAVQRQGDITTMSISADWAAGLSDAALDEQVRRVTAQLPALAPGDVARVGAQDNLTVLRREQRRRLEARMPGMQLGPTVPRPAGLPLDGAFQLNEAHDLPADLLAAIPEGEMVEIELGAPAPELIGPGSAEQQAGFTPAQVAEPLAMGGFGGLSAGDRALRQFGFSAAGEDAIGIVAIPRVNLRPGRLTLPDPAALLDYWGHTAIVVRRGGTIVLVRGFNPDASFPGGMLRLLRESGAVEAGRSSLPAVVSADEYLYAHPRAMTVEWPVDPALAEQAAADLGPTGPAGELGYATDYTARPADFTGPCTTSNCGLWAVEQVESRLGGPMGRAGQGSITSVGPGGQVVPRTASQGRIMGLLSDAEAGGPPSLSPMPNAIGPPVASGMPTTLRVLKVGGRVLVVIGIAADAYEFFSASAAEKPRVAVGIAGGIGGGWLGGMAAGAAAGLVCGPGAPVCSFVLGLLGGIAGALGGRSLLQHLYDLFPEEQRSPCIEAYRYMEPVGQGECPNCHRIRRVQECRDEVPFLRSMASGRPSMDVFPSVRERAGGSWSNDELQAFVVAGQRLNTPSPRPLSPQEIAQLTQWLGAE